jgi:flagellar basal-body rod protein FlgF
MENSGYIALSRMSAMRREMDVLANNMANMNSNAYKGERVMFEEYLSRGNTSLDTRTNRFSFVTDSGVLRDFRTGKVNQTGNPLDLAITGNGYLTVETPQGRRYTRDGHLRLDEDRRLVTAGGHPVLDNRNRPIVFPANETSPPTIAADGTITSGQNQVGKIELVTFENEQGLRKTAQGLFATDLDPQPAPEATTIAQGALESSNVEPILEMTNMIELLRQYQNTQNLIDGEHDRLRRAVERLGRVTQ